MENWRWRLLLRVCVGASLFALHDLVAADEQKVIPNLDTRAEQLIQPEIKRTEYHSVRIKADDFEVGVYTGLLAVEDFTVNSMIGVRASYHMTEDFFLELAYGATKVGKSSYERGTFSVLTDEKRNLTYYTISIGYNMLPGEVFIGSKKAFNTDLYLAAGVGSVKFAGNEVFDLTYGWGYRFVAADWWDIHLGMRVHSFVQPDIQVGVLNSTNIELHTGVAVYF